MFKFTGQWLSMPIYYTEDVRARERAPNIEIALYIVLVLICLEVDEVHGSKRLCYVTGSSDICYVIKCLYIMVNMFKFTDRLHRRRTWFKALKLC